MFPVLAEFTPLSPQAQLALVSLLAVALLILAIRSHLRRQPPLDSELVKLNAALDGLKVSVDTLNEAQKAHASHASEIEALQEKVRTLEARREEDLRAQRTYTRETTHEIFVKLDALKDSVNSNFQTVERAMGQLEGKIELLRPSR